MRWIAKDQSSSLLLTFEEVYLNKSNAKGYCQSGYFASTLKCQTARKLEFGFIIQTMDP